MKDPEHVSEESLIELHLHESKSEAAIREHLEHCPQCAAVSESIAETLRIFSASPVPPVDLDHQWQLLRRSLAPLRSKPERQRGVSRWFLWTPALAGAAVALLMAITYRPWHPTTQETATVPSMRPGPLTSTPHDPQIAQQLDSAERLLTAVNHTSGPLDEATREEARHLLLKNAVYIRTARVEGDPGTAAVLDDLGRVLTNIEHANDAEDSGWHLRLEWNTKGLLLDIRILQQNESRAFRE
jgi:hypothetical protein